MILNKEVIQNAKVNYLSVDELAYLYDVYFHQG